MAHAAPTRLDDGQARHLLLRTGFAPSPSEAALLVGQDSGQAVGQIIAAAKASHPGNPPPAFVAAPAPALTALVALRSALTKLGAWDRTLVISFSEFGRRPRQNQSNGTDHGTAPPHCIAGGARRAVWPAD